jgi:hypothetical protein
MHVIYFFLLVQLDVWAMKREAAAIKASLSTLTCEVQRLSMLCEERREAEVFKEEIEEN